MRDVDYREELNQTISVAGRYLFIDPTKKKVGGTVMPHWNMTLLGLSVAMEQNPLIMGEPGFGKTTAMKCLSAITTGYPYDLYEAAQIQGHPDQTYETMIARLDFSKLKEKESVIWLLSAYLPIRNVDEINRLPTGNQDELLNSLETGRFSYLNDTFFYIGKTPFFATANHPDDGNHIMIPPLRDRFPIHVELGYIGATYDTAIEKAEANLEELCRPDMTDRIISIINDPSLTVQERLARIDEERKDYVRFIESDEVGVKVYSADDRKAMQKQIKAVPLSDEAQIMLRMIFSELNYTPTFGRKRSNDKRDTSNHAKGLASTQVKNALSPRGIQRGIKRYAQGIAYLAGHREVTKDHLMAVAPHAIGHRVEFEQDFIAEHEDKSRTVDEEGNEDLVGMSRELFLAKQLVKGVEGNYTGAKKDFDLLNAAYKKEELTEEQIERANGMLSGEVPLDHPLCKELVMRIKEVRDSF